MKRTKKLLVFIFALMHKIRVLTNFKFKELSFGLVFKGKNRQAITDISRAFVQEKRNIFNELGSRVVADPRKNQYVVTASPECYVELYFKNLIVIGTTFCFSVDDIYEGIKFNCYGANKVIALNECGILAVDEFFTDSFSDKPVMDISKSTFLVKRDFIREL